MTVIPSSIIQYSNTPLLQYSSALSFHLQLNDLCELKRSGREIIMILLNKTLRFGTLAVQREKR
jgi:hypothetical protein